MSRYEPDAFTDFWGPVLAIIFVVAVFLTTVLQVSEGTSHTACHTRGEDMQETVTYRKWNGCYVSDNGLWTPIDIYVYNRDHGIVK